MLRMERPKSAKIRPLSSASTSSTGTSQQQLPQLENTIQKVLIANRGEIACRIIRTCRSLGIPTVAIYSSADGPHCLHATMADEAYLIGSGPSSTESYLRSAEIIDVAQRTKANAIHPGFGFLSERASFAQQVQDHRLIFVGPPVQAMQDMASKSRAKHMMDEAGVPTTPGFDPYTSNSNKPETLPDETTNINHITNELLYDQAVHHVGFPLLIKALMGGGGKGMRLVHTAQDFRDALQSCQNEARQSFGDARVLLERYLIHPRHIEVQIIGDQYNNIVHLYERDCSVQRRHQKVLEEAPASHLSEEFRNYIGQLGVKAASAVNYFNAGTVEFLLDTRPQQNQSSIPGSDQPHPNIYFCEMNTRLQVEHSVTEQITGIDLVEWQLRVAAGEMLPIPQQEHIPKVQGHSIEARIYAETPTKQFLPSPGRIWYHSPPTKPNVGTDPMTGVRVDTGVQSGQDVSVYYDPMIAKLICHGTNRNDAIEKLQTALQNYHIAGVSNNVDFLLRCIQHPTFRGNRETDSIDTGFIEQYGVSIIQDCINHESTRKSHHPMARIAGAMAILLQMEQRIQSKDGNTLSTTQTNMGPWSSHSGSWRMGGDTARAQRKLYLMPEKYMMTCTSNRDGSYDMNWCSDDGNGDDTFFHVDGTLCLDGDMELMVNRTQRLKMTTVMKEENGIIQVRMWPTIGKSHRNDYCWEIDVLDPLSNINVDGMTSETTTPMGNGIVVTPMPGKVSRINFKVGDVVRVGDVVVVLEAMKMEHPCTSTCNGTITEIRVTPNTIVPDSSVLFVVTSESIK